MNPQAARAALQLALFVVIAAGLSLLCVRPGSAEFIVTVLSLVVGLMFLGAVAFFIRRFSR